MKKKICYVASAGGHLEEILGLEPLRHDYESILITEKTNFKPDVWQNEVYTVPAVNRDEWNFIFKLVVIFFKGLGVLVSQRPHCIISTGALMTVPVCLAAKFLGKRVIYIESIARVRSGSATGKLLYRFADLFIVQWETMLDVYPNAVVGGKLI